MIVVTHCARETRRYIFDYNLSKYCPTRNQYASPPRQCNTGSPLSDFLSDFYKIRRGEGCPRSVASSQTSWLWLLKCGLGGVKIAKIGNFWYKFAQKGNIPSAIFFYKICVRREVPGPHYHANFYHCRFINMGLWPQNCQKC